MNTLKQEEQGISHLAQSVDWAGCTAMVVTAIVMLGGATGIAFYVTLERIDRFSLGLYQTALKQSLPIEQGGLWVVVAFLAWGMIYRLFQRQARSQNRRFSGLDLLRVFCPVLPLALLGVLPPGIYSPILMIIGFGAATLRGMAAWPSPQPSPSSAPEPMWCRFLPVAVVLMALGMAGVGFWYQVKALNTLYLLCTDWADYLTAVDNTLHGRWFVCNNSNFLGSHFSPGSILLLCPYVWLFNSKEAFFLLNSLILYGNVILLFWLARGLRVPVLYASGLALCMLLSPSLINMNVSLFYGFHDICMAMPLILLFFIFLEKKWWVPVWLCFGASLLIKETVPVFWAGLGLVFILWGRRKTGTALFVCSCIYWLLAVHVFIPALSLNPGYDYAGRFAHLGQSTWEIMMSPLLCPRIFMEYLLRPGCVYFVVMLVLPVLFLVINRPLLLLGSGVTIVFVCVQSSDQLQNIHMQYQAETVVLIFICAAYNLHWILAGNPGWIFRCLCRWTGFQFTTAGGARAVLVASLVTSAGSFWFFGENPWGKTPSTKFTNRQDFSQTVEALKKLIPPGAPMQATFNVGGHFLLRNPVSTDLGAPSPAPYVLLELNNSFNGAEQVDRFRKQLLASGYHVIFSQAKGVVNLVLLTSDSTFPAVDDQLISMTDEEWRNFGHPVVDVFPPELQIRAELVSTPRPMLHVRVRLDRKVDCDYNIRVTMKSADGSTSYDQYVFGNAVSPAFIAKPGQAYALVLPSSGKLNFNIKIKKRPDIN